MLIIPTGYVSPDHPREALFEEKFVCMVWKDSAMARGELTFDRYVSAEHAGMRPTGSGVDAFAGWFLKRFGVTRRMTVTTYSFLAVPALVVGTERIATVHERLADRLVHAWPLEIRPCPVEIQVMEQSMQWHKFRTKDPGLMWLRSLLVEAARRIDHSGPAP